MYLCKNFKTKTLLTLTKKHLYIYLFYLCAGVLVAAGLALFYAYNHYIKKLSWCTERNSHTINNNTKQNITKQNKREKDVSSNAKCA